MRHKNKKRGQLEVLINNLTDSLAVEEHNPGAHKYIQRQIEEAQETYKGIVGHNYSRRKK